MSLQQNFETETRLKSWNGRACTEDYVQWLEQKILHSPADCGNVLLNRIQNWAVKEAELNVPGKSGWIYLDDLLKFLDTKRRKR
jgi:uncharacterized protein YjhX (UPF0386 family)